MTHTFEFETPASNDKSKILQNILYISQEDEKKHFIQYIQYEDIKTPNGEEAINFSHVNIKVDRSYFLEIANICLDNRERRRQLFSTLGKRRFGANNKKYDYYFVKAEIDEKLLQEAHSQLYAKSSFDLCYSNKSEHSTNQYRVDVQEVEGSHFAFLDQINITKRRKLQKNFCVELIDDEVEILKSIKNRKQRINYIFNKIGKIHFKSLATKTAKTTSQHKESRALALSLLIKNSADLELSSRANDNLFFRELKAKRELMDRVDLSVYKVFLDFINNPYNEDSKKLLNSVLSNFIEHTKEMSQLDEISTHLSALNKLIEMENLSYTLAKKDNDLKDIFLYMLETFTLWNQYLYEEEEDLKGFNTATVDFVASLRYLMDICFKFKHEYKCLDANKEQHQELLVEETPTIQLHQEKITSAEEFFQDVTLEAEVYDELRELESEIEDIFYLSQYSEDINRNIIVFFEGYTRVLNPLFEFKDLSYSFMLLSQKLSEYELNENADLLIELMRGLITDLLEWKKTVLIEKIAEDIHYMDKSFYSNIAQIEMSITHLEISEDDDLIEFF